MTTHYIPKVTFQSTCTLYYLFISILAYFLVNTIIKIFCILNALVSTILLCFILDHIWYF
jgi:hypothetical protein